MLVEFDHWAVWMLYPVLFPQSLFLQGLSGRLSPYQGNPTHKIKVRNIHTDFTEYIAREVLIKMSILVSYETPEEQINNTRV